ncbi:MAG: hypothetical protein ACERKO_07080, partial [Acetanaerobacterium sp.]
ENMIVIKQRFKKGIITAAVIGILYLAIYFICYQFFFIGRDFHLYTPDWTAKNILWVAAVISAVPAFFGAYLFPYITLAGYIAGVICGELFGKTMLQDDLRSMSYHYGWFICISIYLCSCLIGIVAQTILKRKSTQNEHTLL